MSLAMGRFYLPPQVLVAVAVLAAVGALLGALLDAAYDGTGRPLSLGFLACGLVALALVLWAERGHLFQPLDVTVETEPLPAEVV